MMEAILILHGWDVDSSRYLELKKLLENLGFTVFIPDLPGFGKQKLLKKEMSVGDYVSFVRNYLSGNKLDHVILIAHSFGGRIAIKLASLPNTPVSKLILTGSAGIKPSLAFVKRAIQYIAIITSEVFRFPALTFFKNRIRKLLYFMIGEWDYYKAGDLRETFKKVIAEDLTLYLQKIHVPTLLVWGEKDRVIPIEYAKKMEQLIPHSRLVAVKESGHKLPYEAPQRFVEEIKSFIL